MSTFKMRKLRPRQSGQGIQQCWNFNLGLSVSINRAPQPHLHSPYCNLMEMTKINQNNLKVRTNRSTDQFPSLPRAVRHLCPPLPTPGASTAIKFSGSQGSRVGPLFPNSKSCLLGPYLD